MDVVDTALAVFHTQEPNTPWKDLVRGLYVNAGQSIARTVCTREFPTPATSALVYSYEHDRVISSVSTMALLGWPLNVLSKADFSDSDFRALSGNGFSLPISALLMVIFTTNPFSPWQAS